VKRSFCNSLIFIIIFLYGNIGFSAVFIGEGDAIIEENNLKVAEINARTNAIKNSIYNYLKNKLPEDDTFPEITTEYFKFLKSYKILSRSVENYRVTYTVESDIIDFDIEDVYHMVKNIVASAVYVINLEGDLGDIEENEIRNIVEKKLNSYSFDTKYEGDYLFALKDERNVDEVITHFANSKAQYLFILLIDSDVTRIDKNVYSRVGLLTNIYTREKKYKPIKAISTTTAKDSKEAFTSSINKSLDKMLDYVSNNMIKLNKNNNSINSFNIDFENFKKVGDVYELLDFIAERGWIISYNVGSFERGKVVAEIKTIFSLEDLVDRILKYKEDKKFNIAIENDKIKLDFNSL
jgi:hypothetical protein